ncbi:MAG: efflux RND transporter periplasmic adaptor subunit [Pseudomonadota bacterium]
MRPAIFLSLMACAALAIPALGGSVRAAEYTVVPVMVDDRKAVFGTVESLHETQARARIAGTLVELSVAEGDRVSAGQRIAYVEDPKLVLQLAEIEAKLKSLQAQRAQAQIDFDRISQLRKAGTASQAQLDQARTNLDVVVGQMAAMEASRQLVREQQAEGAVLAPVDGRILKVKMIEGTVAMPGEAIATLAEQTYVLRIYLPERHARFIKAGDLVQVGARGLSSTPEELRDGHVRLVYPELDHGRVVADVEVSGLGDFFVGERTRVYVATGRRETFIVPPGFVSRRFGVYYVNLRDGGEVVVQVGEQTPQGVEVLSGIRPGDVLVSP